MINEEQLRKAFKAGETFGSLPFNNNSKLVTEDDYIRSLKENSIAYTREDFNKIASNIEKYGGF